MRTCTHHAAGRLTPASWPHTPPAWAPIHWGLRLLHHRWHSIVAIVVVAIVAVVVVVVHHGGSTHARHHTPLQHNKAERASGIALPDIETYTKQAVLLQGSLRNKLCNHT